MDSCCVKNLFRGQTTRTYTRAYYEENACMLASCSVVDRTFGLQTVSCRVLPSVVAIPDVPSLVPSP